MVDAFDDFRRFEEMMNRFFENFYGTYPRRQLLSSGEKELTLTGYREPKIDIVETDKDIIATVEMPGLDKKDIKINLTDNRLEVSAETKHEEKKEEKDYVYRERKSACYYRGIPLPTTIDSDKSKATYNNGVLEIKMPKIEVKTKKLLKID